MIPVFHRATEAQAAPRWERWAVAAILLSFSVIQGNSIRHSSFIGQDYGWHVANTERVVAQHQWWLAMNDTTRPMQYWVGGACQILTNGKYTYELTASIATLLAVLALSLVHASIRSVVRAPLLRVAALALISFLPVTLVTAVVYASDTFTLLPFALGVWSLGRSLEATDSRAAAGYALLAGMALILGNLTKLSFFSLPFAVVGVLVVLAWWRRLAGQRALVTGLLAGLLPLLATLLMQWVNAWQLGGEHASHRLDWSGTGEMTWRSLIGLKRSDARILDAPTYWDSILVDGTPVVPMLEHNGYSYPALLHLAVFTDVLSYTHRGGFDRSQPRPFIARTFARYAVRSGLLFSVATAVAVLAFYSRMILALLHRDASTPPALLVWAAFALVWYLPLVLTLPYMRASYEWGYWLPRFVLPALWGFAVILFAAVDRLTQGKYPCFNLCVLFAVLLQSAIQIRSIW